MADKNLVDSSINKVQKDLDEIHQLATLIERASTPVFLYDERERNV